MLTGGGTLTAVLMVFLLRFILGPVSYAASIPGGLFAPLLLLGAQTGLIFGIFTDGLLPGGNQGLIAYAVVGMAALFTTVVRAPITGIVLVIEMTGSVTLLLPMLAASFTAMLIPALFRVPPIYDSLRAHINKLT